MNSKKSKNKNRPNKPTNPSPPQKNEPLVTEKAEEVTSADKPEAIPSVAERVPEIITEVIPPVSESVIKDEDSPKKPKRNRGKKKKPEIDETDNQENQPQEEFKLEGAEALQLIILDEPTLTPSARKKKNKNKKPIESEQKHIEKTEDVITEPKIEEKETKVLTSKEVESVSTSQCDNPSDPEATQKKKNKKKKNLTDSEKSEKGDDVTCTAAFQKLIKDDKAAEQKETSEVSNKNKAKAEVEKSVVVIPPVTVKEDKSKDPVKELAELSKQSIDDIAYEATNKNKKKNKKDEKNLPKKDDSSRGTEIILIDDYSIQTSTSKEVDIDKSKSTAVEEPQKKELTPERLGLETIILTDDISDKDLFEAAIKNKKKNKKDKKNPPKDLQGLGVGSDLSREAEIILIDDYAIQTPTPKDVHIDKTESTTVEEPPKKELTPERLGLETIILTDDISDKDFFETANKNKKKNKKDKKNPPRDLQGIGEGFDLSREAEIILIDDYATQTSTPKDVDVDKTESTIVEEPQKKELTPEKLGLETIILTDDIKNQDAFEAANKNKKKNKKDKKNTKDDELQGMNKCFELSREAEIILIDDYAIQTSTPKDVHIDKVESTTVEEPHKKELTPERLCLETIILTDDTGDKNTFETASKNKKKNKKDKKNPPKDDNLQGMDKSSDLSREAEIILIDDYAIQSASPKDTQVHKIDTTIAGKEHQMKELLSEPLGLETIILQEEVGTSKAVIAKPVERKHKGKGQDQNKESVSKSTTEDKKIEGEDITQERILSQDQSTKSKPEVVKPPEIFKSNEKPASTLEEKTTDNKKLVVNIPPPACEMGKKRKKSPKPMKSDIAAKLETDLHLTKIDAPPRRDETDKITPTVIDVSIKGEFKQEKPEKDTKKSETKLEKALESEPSAEAQQKDNKTDDHKGKKKRKKSPKLPETIEIDKKNIIEGQPLPQLHENIQDAKDDSKGKSVVLPAQTDLKTSSPKAEDAEGTVLAPDIQYPRAISHDPTDGNNNMAIQEIFIMDDSNLQMSVDVSEMPFIQGSGITPTMTPELLIIGNVTKDAEPKNKKPIEQEKTDLKSKMIEVNQDMEELRLSIERSLAEFTSIEKGEQENVEKEFADKILHITEEADVKPRMPSELAVKSSDETRNDEVTEKLELSTDKNKTTVAQSCEKSAVIEPEYMAQPIRISTEDIPLAIPLGESLLPLETIIYTETPPVCPSRKENKNKGKNKKKGKHEVAVVAATTTGGVSTPTASSTDTSEVVKDEKSKKDDTKSDKKTESTQEKGKQQSATLADDNKNIQTERDLLQTVEDFEPIESFEDAMTSSVDDINKTFEMIANDANRTIEGSHVNPEISITVPKEDKKQIKKDDIVNPVSPPKNLLGHPDIPVPSNRIDYKKEKNKPPNETLAKVKIKDAIEIEAKRESKESQTENIRKFMKNKSMDESFSLTTNENEEFIYKYSFRKVFLQSACHVCKKELKQARVPCSYCNIVFYCNSKHKDDDWPQHQALCFAVSTIAHLKDQKHIYADSKDISGQNYRLLRMQMIVSCEKVLKRRLAPWEQEALLYPRVCADMCCREWRQNKLLDCDGCGQISYCADHPDHFPKTHQRWCKSYSLYSKLVCYQQTQGRLEPKLPGKVMVDYRIPDKMNEVLASMYEEKIDMNDMQYAALTQIATAPLTAAYSYQTNNDVAIHTNGIRKKSTCTIHVVGAELQYEADALNKWEVFFLHLLPRVKELVVVLIATDLNPSNLPLELLSKVKLCENCRMNNRKIVFNFQDRKTYHEYCNSDEYIQPNIVCAFNASISRSTLYSKDPWPSTINSILKQRVPFLITSYTINEIHRDLSRIKECAEHSYNVIVQPKNNNFASVRPDRNFISDDEMPLLFKNYCCLLVCGVC